VSLASADVTATVLTKPVTKPIENLAHELEVVGIFVGLVTGLHPLTMICAKYLVHDKMADVLATTFQKLIDEFTAAEACKPTTVGDAQEAASETSKPAVQAGLEETSADDAADRKRLERADKMSRGEPLEPSEILRKKIIRYQDAVSQEPVSQETAVKSEDAASAT